jgi:hypothetical protein
MFRPASALARRSVVIVFDTGGCRSIMLWRYAGKEFSRNCEMISDFVSQKNHTAAFTIRHQKSAAVPVKGTAA